MTKRNMANAAIWAAFLLILLSIPITICVNKTYFFRDSVTRYTDIAQIGDWIGGITAPFLAVAGSLLVFAAFMRQADDSELNARIQLKQEFEATFLQMIQMLREVKKEVNETYSNKETFFDYAVGNIRQSGKESAKRKQEYMEHFYPVHRNKIDHYLALVQHIAEYTDSFGNDREIPDIEQFFRKKEKMKLLSYQFTLNELIFIHTDWKCRNKAKEIITKYQFFESIEKDTLV